MVYRFPGNKVLSGAGFSLWVLVLARTNPHRLKPAPLEPPTRMVLYFLMFVITLQ